MRLASRFGYANQIRRDRPLTREELMQVVPSVFGEEKHTSRSENYTWIPTITVLESLQREGFQPFFACQTRVRDPGRRGYTKPMAALMRHDGFVEYFDKEEDLLKKFGEHMKMEKAATYGYGWSNRLMTDVIS